MRTLILAFVVLAVPCCRADERSPVSRLINQVQDDVQYYPELLEPAVNLLREIETSKTYPIANQWEKWTAQVERAKAARARKELEERIRKLAEKKQQSEANKAALQQMVAALAAAHIATQNVVYEFGCISVRGEGEVTINSGYNSWRVPNEYTVSPVIPYKGQWAISNPGWDGPKERPSGTVDETVKFLKTVVKPEVKPW